MTISCFIVDDEQHSIDLLTHYIEQTPDLKLIGTSTNPVAAIPLITGANPPMLTFLDVDMPELSGIEMAGLIKDYTHIIFTTAHRDYAFQAFEQDANDFMLKPIPYPRFLKSIVKIKKVLETKNTTTDEKSDHFYIKTEVKGKMQKVVIKDILYVEGAQNYVTLHFAGSKVMAYLTMSEVEENLPAANFSRVHKSFIVNNSHIKTLEHGQLTLDYENTHIPIGRSYKDDFLARMKTALLVSKRD